MKLKELLQKVSFDDMVPHIIAFEPEHVTQISYYKETYDILMILTKYTAPDCSLTDAEHAMFDRIVAPRRPKCCRLSERKMVWAQRQNCLS